MSDRGGKDDQHGNPEDDARDSGRGPGDGESSGDAAGRESRRRERQGRRRERAARRDGAARGERGANDAPTGDGALTLGDVAVALDRAEMKFEVEEDANYIRLAFESEHYRDDKGRNSIRMYISVRDEGQLVLVEAPFLYQIKKAKSRGTARKAVLAVNFSLKSIQYSVDPDDADEVRGRLEIWPEGAEIKPDYLRTMLVRLALQIDYCDRLLRPVWERGRTEYKKLLERKMRPRATDRKRSSLNAGAEGKADTRRSGTHEGDSR